MQIESDGFILHTRPYKETSFLVDVFSKDHGRIKCIAKGYRSSSRKKISGKLSLFMEYQFLLRGKGELKVISSSEEIGDAVHFGGERLFVGLYLNELLFHFLADYDPCSKIYVKYHELLKSLDSGNSYSPILRRFELLMLDELGYGLVLDSEYESGQPVVMSKNYKYIFGLGVTSILNRSEEGNFFSGEELLGIYNNEFNDLLIDRAARRLLRGVFDFYLEGKQMNSRELYRQYLEGIRNNASNVRSIK